MKNKNILVTGGLGFIGSHFVELLHEKCSNCKITIIDNYTYCVSQKTEDYLWDMYTKSKRNSLHILYQSISDFKLVEDYDYIINFAAESHVDNSIKNGDPFIESNVVGVYHLLNQLKGTLTKQLLIIGGTMVAFSLGFKTILNGIGALATSALRLGKAS